MLRTADLDYPLPEELIATTPAEPRDSARLLVVSRSDPSRLEHRRVSEIADIFRPPAERASMPPDLMVVNATRVLPARFKGVRTDTGGGVEGLYLRPDPAMPPDAHELRWIVLLKMRRAKPGAIVSLFNRRGEPTDIALHLIERTAEDNGAWLVSVARASRPCSPSESQDLLNAFGLTPVPPYILASRKRHDLAIDDTRDRSMYQTVYAAGRAPEGHGSVAAPTAGLHFTPDLLARLHASGVQRAECSLDVGLGTFKPVETEYLEQHPMHTEWCHVPQETAEAIRALHRGMGLPAHVSGASPEGLGWHASPTRVSGASPESLGWEPHAPQEPHTLPPTHSGPKRPERAAAGHRARLLAIGTTTVRTLESFASPEEMLAAPTKDTRLLITPGYRFKHVDALLTNFHLPQSTLLALVAAFLSPPDTDPAAAVARLTSIYAEAIRQRYRFFSFGDAMLILP